jgi:hypothetical protein
MKLKIIIPNLLYFDSGHFVNGEIIGAGYYFKGKFISRYKSEMIEELRKVFNDDFSDENKRRHKDEFKVIHYFYELGKKATKITEKKKKPYYAQRRKAKILGMIGKLKAQIEEYEKLVQEIDKEIRGKE